MLNESSFFLKIAAAVGFCHLVIVAVGAAGIEFPDQTRLGRALSYYGELSGASYEYGFFSPGVTSQIRAVFDVVEKDSRHSQLQLMDESNREVDLRIGDIVEQFMETGREDQMKFQRELSASLSGAVFARHPGARSVTIHLELFTPISMGEFRRGHRPVWKALYSAEFKNRQRSLE